MKLCRTVSVTSWNVLRSRLSAESGSLAQLGLRHMCEGEEEVRGASSEVQGQLGVPSASGRTPQHHLEGLCGTERGGTISPQGEGLARRGVR